MERGLSLRNECLVLISALLIQLVIDNVMSKEDFGFILFVRGGWYDFRSGGDGEL